MAGDWHLLDYKSNQVVAAGVPDEAAQYELQMFVYALACKHALGTAPMENVLNFLRPQVEHSFSFNEHRSLKLEAQLDEAISAFPRTTDENFQ